MRVSTVINTYNRCRSLGQTLDSLQQQRYRDFEVIVVNGPSSDGTDDMLTAWQSDIRVARCPVANLAVSRNIGIAAAAGEIVAFIDDDAIPDPRWLEAIVAGYDAEEVGGVGGPVYDSTGYTLQTQFILCDRFGNAITDYAFNPTELFNTPGAPRYVAHLGTNTSFRRDLLLEIGGFDEEFVYYLDETDLCLRVVDHGRVVKYVEDAFVYHKFAPSHLRNEKKALTSRYQVLKSQAYFAFKHGAPAHGYVPAMQSIVEFATRHRDETKWAVEHGHLPPDALPLFEEELRRAARDGVEDARAGRPKLLSPATIEAHRGRFKRFLPCRIAAERLTLCLFSRQYPPGAVDGIGRSVYELARALAELGHTVHVLTQSAVHSRVDLEEGVWVHRLAICEQPPPPIALPAEIWNYSRTLMDEVERIDRHDHVALIEAPAWDCEGIAALFSEAIPVVTSLHTPMLIAASMHPDWLTDAGVMRRILPIAFWERQAMLFSDGLSANTAGILEVIERDYDLALDRSRTAVVSRGLRDRSPVAPAPGGQEELRILFIGRLEYRKGIDLLLDSLPKLLAAKPELRVDIIGSDQAADEPGGSFTQRFYASAAGASWAAQVHFHGKLPEESLDRFLERCDILAAPSRFESFGLIYLEAMMFGKPVIGSAGGGIAEVVGDSETGLLVAPGDRAGFAAALERLVDSASLRRQLGEAGRRRFLRDFTPRAMAERALALYRRVITATPDLRPPASPREQKLALSRRCALAEFWPTAPLHPYLAELGPATADRRLWAYGLAVAALAQRRSESSATRPRALAIVEAGFPSLASQAPEWEIEEIASGAPSLPSRQNGDRPHRPLTALGCGAGRFDLVLCLVVLDPLSDAFAAIIGEIARCCRIGGSVQLMLAGGAGAPQQLEAIATRFAATGIEPEAELADLLADAPEAAGFHDEAVEPCLGVMVEGVARPVAAIAFRHRAVARAALAATSAQEMAAQ